MKKSKMIFYIAVTSLILILSFVIRFVKTSESKEFVITYNSSYKSIFTTYVSSKVTDASFTTVYKAAVTTTTKVAETETSNVPLYIDINTADIDLLCQLDGIGEGLAKAIIRYREENDGFNNIEEIMNIHGIGEGTFENICDFIYVENPVYPENDEVIEDNDTEFTDDFSEYEESETIDEYEEITTEPSLKLEDVVPIDINSADLDLLLLLPYIDEETAQNIIEFRESIGGFKNIYEILYIEGISREQANEILEYICIDNDYEVSE
ncbi:MAG: helix-hairpin-helix domain-containing protein [Ruminococcus sp.]|nr:helix-hairpin-helix domain-containing protein [Ruminococcus sp.]